MLGGAIVPLNTTWRVASLADNRLQAEGAIHLGPALARHSKLTDIDLSDNELGTRGTRAMVQQWRKSMLGQKGRKDLNEKLAGGDVKLSVNDFLVRAAALAMHQHPDFNASFDGDAIVQHGAVNVGIAISLHFPHAAMHAMRCQPCPRKVL